MVERGPEERAAGAVDQHTNTPAMMPSSKNVTSHIYYAAIHQHQPISKMEDESSQSED